MQLVGDAGRKRSADAGNRDGLQTVEHRNYLSIETLGQALGQGPPDSQGTWWLDDLPETPAKGRQAKGQPANRDPRPGETAKNVTSLLLG